MDYQRYCCLILGLTSFLIISFSTNDDAAIMSMLSASISPIPPSWNSTNFCTWEGISCDSFSSVISINLASKSLTGTLPSDLNGLSLLQTLKLQENSLSGPLPSLYNLALLEQVILDNNNFTSIPSDFFHGLTNLNSFSISNNLQLSPWSLPNDLNNSINLQSFHASKANVYGSIPDIFDNLLSLRTLRLSHNNLNGTLDVLSSMTQLTQVWLQDNVFTGTIPDLSKCTVLFDLQLRGNLLTGLVPDTVASLTKLANITLQNNKLQGPLPVFRSGVKVELGVSNNRYCLNKPGKCNAQVTTLLEVAGDLGYPMKMAESCRGDDAFQGWEFVVCDSKKSVISVNFSKQNFCGTISPAFGNLNSLRMLSLNDNNLMGSIPEVLTSLPDLQLLDVSNNNLSGLVPVFPTRMKFSSDNNLLLGKRITNDNINPTDSSGSSVGLVIGIVIGSVGIGLGIVLLVWYKYCYRVSPTELQSEISVDYSEIHSSQSGSEIIPIQMLQKATDDFNNENVLGNGGFGVVYRGVLEDGTKIAVKRRKSGVNGTKWMNDFLAEIKVLTKVRHRHLVALLGYCIDGNESILVYEYMPQGTLYQHLFKWRENGNSPLSWKQRVSIALDVGRGVEYLHSLAQESFIHRDLKPANILLGDDMRAKVADFGLAKITPDGKYSIDTRLAGTFGYLAPEYSATGRVTSKVDVYAFGVVLMQLITGRKALNGTMPDESCQLATWFRRVLITKENMVKYADYLIRPIKPLGQLI